MTRGAARSRRRARPRRRRAVLEATAARRRARARPRTRPRRAGAVAFARRLAREAPRADGARRRRPQRPRRPARRARAARRRRPSSRRTRASSRGCSSCDSAEIERRAAAPRARGGRARSGAVVVLKGDDTLVADPGGRVAVSRGGSPALATAGTGDVLTGVIAALLAQRLDPFTAAAAGVLLHARAGRLAARASARAEGVIATDVIEALPARARRDGRRWLSRRPRRPGVAEIARSRARAGAREPRRDRAQLRPAARRAAPAARGSARSSRPTATATAPCRAPAPRSPAARAGWRWRAPRELRELRDAGIARAGARDGRARPQPNSREALAAGGDVVVWSER